MREKILNIETNKNPKIRIRVITKNDDEFLTKHKKKYPFELEETVEFTIQTTKRTFKFKILGGYFWNGADIPKCLFFIGQSKDNNYLIASMVHDFLIEYRYLIHKEVLNSEISMKEYRRLTSLIFREILKDQKTNTIKANIMAGAVDIFQMTICANKWREKSETDI